MPRIGVDLGVVFTLNNRDFDAFIVIVLAGDRIDIPAGNVANLFTSSFSLRPHLNILIF